MVGFIDGNLQSMAFACERAEGESPVNTRKTFFFAFLQIVLAQSDRQQVGKNDAIQNTTTSAVQGRCVGGGDALQRGGHPFGTGA